MTTTHLSLLIRQSICSHCMTVPCYVTGFLLPHLALSISTCPQSVLLSLITLVLHFIFHFYSPSPQERLSVWGLGCPGTHRNAYAFQVLSGSLAFHTLTLAPKWLKHQRKWCLPFLFLLILCPLHCQRFSLWWPFLNLVIRWRLTSKHATPPTNSCPVLLWILHSPFSILVGPRQGSHAM